MMSPVISEAEAELLPLDLSTMREGVDQLLAEGAEVPGDEDLETLWLRLRGHVVLLIPEVERQARRLPELDRARRSALACVAMSRLELRVGRGDTHLVRVSVAQRLARLVRTLCGHAELLKGATL
ncbi:DUF6415 family natural product biosynthesis protein [Streptomyces caniscabiei]|uniref:DUF6415 family natural product biosynthesis protein n=1 Tax=Streptomyces caniscabiei TaxID=2746961 RepID=UPI0029B7D6E0|nr:DUF6415 family natural product biosynthesis protein [Streptomyces caniscabiei]MDX3507492.1 DUF6415 family natural product biosynthesis protein [Streptomyces caniscabiei]